MSETPTVVEDLAKIIMQFCPHAHKDQALDASREILWHQGGSLPAVVGILHEILDKKKHPDVFFLPELERLAQRLVELVRENEALEDDLIRMEGGKVFREDQLVKIASLLGLRTDWANTHDVGEAIIEYLGEGELNLALIARQTADEEALDCLQGLSYLLNDIETVRHHIEWSMKVIGRLLEKEIKDE